MHHCNLLFHPTHSWNSTPTKKIWESHSPWQVSKDIPDMPIERLPPAPHNIPEVPSFKANLDPKIQSAKVLSKTFMKTGGFKYSRWKKSGKLTSWYGKYPRPLFTRFYTSQVVQDFFHQQHFKCSFLPKGDTVIKFASYSSTGLKPPTTLKEPQKSPKPNHIFLFLRTVLFAVRKKLMNAEMTLPTSFPRQMGMGMCGEGAWKQNQLEISRSWKNASWKRIKYVYLEPQTSIY